MSDVRLISGTNTVDPLAYGFKWFEYHSSQRITAFNFYLVIYSGLAAAVSFLVKEKIVFGSVLVSFLMLVISIIFWQLDIGNRQLIEIGERIISMYWTSSSLDDSLNPIKQSDAKQRSGFRYRILFEIMFTLGAVFGFLSLCYALFALT